MEELKSKVMRKAELLQQLLDLEAEKKQLSKDVFDLRIAANNEQVDVQSLEGFSFKGLILSLQGKKEERLEQERREARHAKSQYDLASARLASIEQQLADIPTLLETLGDCEEQLLSRVDQIPCQDKVERVRLLTQVADTVQHMRAAGDELLAALEELMSWIGADRRSSIVSRSFHRAELQTVSALEVYFSVMKELKSLLKAAQLEMDTSGWQVYDKEYIGGVFGQMARCIEVADQTRGIGFQLKAVQPKLSTLLRQEQIDMMNALVQLL